MFTKKNIISIVYLVDIYIHCSQSFARERQTVSVYNFLCSSSVEGALEQTSIKICLSWRPLGNVIGLHSS